MKLKISGYQKSLEVLIRIYKFFQIQIHYSVYHVGLLDKIPCMVSAITDGCKIGYIFVVHVILRVDHGRALLTRPARQFRSGKF